MATTESREERLARLKQSLVRDKKADVPEAPVPAQAETPPAAPARRSRLLDMLARLLGAPPSDATPGAVAAAPREPPVFTVLVAALAGDAEGTAAATLFNALQGRPGLAVKPLPKAFPLDNMEDPAQVAAVILNTRHAVAEENADLLVWGDKGKDGYRLRLATAPLPGDAPLASFGPTTRIELPFDFAEAPGNLLYAALLAAADPATEAQRAGVRKLLPAAAAAVEALAAKPPVQMSMPQQRSVQLIFGHIAAAAALVAAQPEQATAWFGKAVESYRSAQRRLRPTDAGWEAGLIHKHLAAVLTVQAERTKEAAPLLEEAVKEWRSAAETLTRAMMPQEWAAAQMRLGVALYRLDLITGQTELLREALQVLQGTLQVYTRTETPARWAEVMHAVAQVLEVYGDQMKSAEVLTRAADTCRAVCEVRTRERTPLAWAATQNTLGSALFLLDRHGGGGAHLAEAELVLAAALGIFQSHGATGPAKVAARNLAHVRKLAEARRNRQVADPHWLDG
ncbi:MAG: hypothetical protein HYU60_07520 [Magnetospirillum sp.]|nr:hypothetical protein [Magnetospirillum sp.]